MRLFMKYTIRSLNGNVSKKKKKKNSEKMSNLNY